MDSRVSSALEEICSQGTNGLSLSLLFSKLTLSSDTFTKQSLWSNLLKNPSLQFHSLSSSLSPHDSSIQSFQDAEKLQIKIIAEEQLRDCFVGLYDIKSSDAGISDIQRRTLERLAIARSSGITQSQLCKEFDIRGNNMFYVVKNLECRGLITRQSTTVRTNEASDQKESKVSSIINTNLLHLYRYTKHLGSQQKIEITEADNTMDGNEDVDGGVGTGYGVEGESIKKDFIIKDYVPAMKAVCDKLEEANDKVLVAADIKKDLGYRNSKGHKAWRNICHRLVDARLVEEFDAKVKEKPAPCLRLLRSFDPKEFEPKTHRRGQGDSEIEQLPKFGRRGQITEQVVELPIDNQIYDMIETAASNGLTVFEVCKRLGINNKRNYSRFMNLFSRFGMHLQAENRNRGVAFRAWTAGNFQPDPDDPIASKSVSFSGGKELSYQESGELTVPQDSSQVITEFQTSSRDALPLDSVKTKETGAEHSLCSLEVGQHDNELVYHSNLQDAICEIRDTTPGVELPLGSLSSESGIAPPKTSKPALSSPSKRCSSYPKHPSISLTALSARREQRILERLQEEKFILKPELHKWLESFEKDKGTTMDRKTLMRCLNKLQQEGRCKSVTVGVPVVTNFSHSRTTVVVLHPSVQSLTPELLGQIHDRLRSLNTQVHSQGMSRLKDVQALPVLDSVQRIQRCVESDAQAVRSEAMRANGFVLAKMVRAKLLHNFLWSYLSDSSDWDEALASGEHVYDLKNPHSTWKMFALDAAIKAMPLELFLQVVGSPQKFGDMVEKCKNGIRLSDLPLQEYKVLMDTQATGRLSWIIDILRRLKLIRLTTGGCSGDGDKAPCTSFSHALELRPYIEEPLSMVAPSSGVSSLDLRPRIRHDFILSNKVAVDVYWKTLEFCYAAADRTAALHAFPGSAVHEVFFFRSWASVRVMTADQRAELLKRVVKDDSSQKLSFRQCEEIAKDLDLTFEQVLRVYSDKRLRRLDRFCRAQGANEEQLRPRNSRRLSSRKRKRSTELLLKRKKGDNVSDKFDNQTPGEFSDTDVQFTEEPTTLEIFSEEHGTDLQSSNMRGDKLTVDEPEQTEDGEEHYSLASHCAFPRLKPARQRKFSWSEKADRELVIQYARHRAALGAKFHRTDWISLPDLPAPPSTCRRRMAILNSNMAFRKALMRLCSMLSERYARHLRGSHYTSPNNENLIEGSSSREALFQVSKVLKHSLGPDSKEEQWDNFDNGNIKIALDEVLQYKKLAKLDASKRAGGLSKETDISKVRVGHETGFHSEDGESHDESHGGDTGRRSCRLPQKFIKLLNEGACLSQHVYKSLPVSNAVELYKLIFLSSSTTPVVSSLLAETLRRYSERDLFAAFSYLREKKVMVGGNGSQPFVLSQRFLASLSSSPFPRDTGKRAAKFASWLDEREKDLVEQGIDLPAELQCGDIFHLFALVSSGELFVSPHLPDKGVGEVEDTRSSKRKSDENESSENNKSKKLKFTSPMEGEVISRREKGFPGVKVSVARATISGANALELFKEGKIYADDIFIEKSDKGVQCDGIYEDDISSIASQSGHRKATTETSHRGVFAGGSSKTLWEAMTSYTKELMVLSSDQEPPCPLGPEMFMTAYTAIQRAGDQGLSLKELSEVLDLQGGMTPELIVEALQAFGRVLKVNAFDSVRIVDVLYQPKYFLVSVSGGPRSVKLASAMKSLEINCNLQSENHQTDGTEFARMNKNEGEVHKVTILNLPEEVSRPSDRSQTSSDLEASVQGNSISSGRENENETWKSPADDTHQSKPILPWINGDGSINMIVFRGLTRRILGIVMQNPGILEDDIIHRMDVLNPQSCRKILELMILDNHLIIRKMHQSTANEPPAILGGLLGSRIKRSKLIVREHFFANPMSTSLL